MSVFTLEQELDGLTKTKPPLIKASRHPTLPLTIYNYTEQAQWKKFWGILTTMCRGLVLEQGTSRVIARPMPKFFNHSEGLHKTPDTDPFTVLEKVDGSLGIWFCYNGQWMMATRGSFTSPQAIEGQRLAVRAGLPGKCDSSLTYCFEIIYPENRLIVNYKNQRELILLAVLRNDTGEDRSNKTLPSIADKLGVCMAKSIKPVNASIEALSSLDALNEEGFVIRFDTTGERLKIKFATYIQMSRAGMSGYAGANHGPDAASVKQVVVDLLMKHPHGCIEDHLAAIPDEFFDDAKAAQKEYMQLYEKNEAGFDGVVARYKDISFRDIDASIPRHDLICKYLACLRRGTESSKGDIKHEYASSVTAKAMGCWRKAKRKPGA